MAIASLIPYLNFNGNARQAVELYQRALGAKVETLQPFAEAPGTEKMPDAKERIIHALLRLDGNVLMLSDIRAQDPEALPGNAHVCLGFDDAADMARRFEALSAGGRVTMPIHDTFWGAKFGMLTDAFGIQWMFNCDKPKT
jgi:PhnB protein